jgi:hypothetical protein
MDTISQATVTRAIPLVIRALLSQPTVIACFTTAEAAFEFARGTTRAVLHEQGDREMLVFGLTRDAYEELPASCVRVEPARVRPAGSDDADHHRLCHNGAEVWGFRHGYVAVFRGRP